MIDHTGVPVSNWARSKAFYDAAFAALGGGMTYEIPMEFTGGAHVAGYGRERGQFWISEEKDVSGTRHVAFTARSRAEVDAFYTAALAAGGKDNGKPGLRPHYDQHYYGAFVFDPDGNNIEAVCRLPE
jgi:catechol 2,3-dioxygenase-like lactoylglutathione lyase family enzyme